MVDPVQVVLAALRQKPGQYSEGVGVTQRSSRYGEALVVPAGKPQVQLADEGSYFVAMNPTPGTAIAGIAGTGAFSDAESLLLVSNDNSASSGKRIYLDYLKLLVVVAGTNGTDHRYVSKLDSGNRYTSGGSSITPVNPNMDVSETSGATVRFGALVTTAASSNARLVSQGLIRNVITVAGDEYVFDFGGSELYVPAHAIAGTAIARVGIKHPPVVIGPGQVFVMSLHATAQTVASEYEFELGYWVK